MRVEVDQSRCQGHSRCLGIAPEMFEVDDYGMSSVLSGGAVPAGLEDKARLAAANCPEHAITLSFVEVQP